MSRKYCNVCTRALNGCICCFTTVVSNKHLVTILRHPSEIKNVKGTAQLLNLSLDNIKLFDGENFDPEDILCEGYENILVFPSNEAVDIKSYIASKDNVKLKNFIFIDGTWKKAYKIFQINPFLKELVHMKLSLATESAYAQVRKQRSGGYSTLESVVTVLNSFEENPSLAKLEKSFIRFIHQLKNLSNATREESEQL